MARYRPTGDRGTLPIFSLEILKTYGGIRKGIRARNLDASDRLPSPVATGTMTTKRQQLENQCRYIEAQAP
eukprot:1179866-Prorocentrum_minimum.AAC.1